MRMAHAIATLLAVLCAAVGAGADELLNATRFRRSPVHPNPLPDEMVDPQMLWKRQHFRQMQMLFRHPENDSDLECCPSVMEMIKPKGGKNLKGMYVDLYEQQQLYEISCAQGVAGKPCRFIDARFSNHSECIQKYSYSYALVKNPETTTENSHPRGPRNAHFSVTGDQKWTLDYVRVRAGCECQLSHDKDNKGSTPVHRKRERHKHKRKLRRHEKNDET